MPNPVLQALLLADHVYQDKISGKHVICGIFSTLNAIPLDQKKEIEDARTPLPDGGTHVNIEEVMSVGSPYVYVSMTELSGAQQHFALRYVDLRDNSLLIQMDFDCRQLSPLVTVELFFAFPPLPIPHEGEFALELLCDNELIGSHRVIAQYIKPKQAGDLP